MTRELHLSRPPSPSQRQTAIKRCCWLLVALSGCATETTDNPARDDDPSSSGGSSAVGGSKSGGSSAVGGSKSGGSSGSGGTKTTAGSPATTAGAAGVSTGGTSAGNTAGGNKTGGASSTAGTAGSQTAGGGAGGGTGGSSSGGAGAGGGGSSAGGSGSAMCDNGVAFCDDFEDQNANGWTKSGGTWSVVQDAADWVYEGGNGSEEAYAGDGTWTDQTVAANVKVVKFGGTSDSYRAGIMARHSSGSNFYVFALGGDGKLTLRKSTSTPSGTGTCAALAPGVDTTGWFKLKMIVTGNAGSVRIQTFINDQPKHDCTTTSSPLTQGQVGVLTYGSGTVAHFDDVSVTTP